VQFLWVVSSDFIALGILLVPACRLKKENTVPKTPKNGHGIELRGRNDIERAQDLSSKAQDEEEGNSSGGQSKKPDDGQN
jgi:hypothetical protein